MTELTKLNGMWIFGVGTLHNLLAINRFPRAVAECLASGGSGGLMSSSDQGRPFHLPAHNQPAGAWRSARRGRTARGVSRAGIVLSALLAVSLLPTPNVWALPPVNPQPQSVDLPEVQKTEEAPADEPKIEELASWSGAPVEPPAEYVPVNDAPPVNDAGTTTLTPETTVPVQVGDLPVYIGKASATADEPSPPAPNGTWGVEVEARTTTEASDVDGAIITVTPPATGSTPIDIELDYSKFADLFGNEWATRLRLQQLPACFLETPELDECSTAVDIPSTNDPAQETVRATVDPADGSVQGMSTQAGGSPVVLTASDSGAGAGGTYKATPLSPSGTWSVGGSSGGFTWTYPLSVPAPPAGPAPKVAFTYSSQSVDGKTSVANSQASWIGDGWDYHPGFVERRYRSCSDDRENSPNNDNETDKKKSDLCWASDNLVMSLGGTTTELVHDANGNWVPANDDGAEIEYLVIGGDGKEKVKAEQGAKYDGEYWRVTTRDGTRYYFGRNDLDGTGTRAVTNSVFTVPVVGNHTGEPCHQATYATSFCTQAWRWNLDYVEDVHGNAMTIDWMKEANRYAQNGKYKQTVEYVRGGYPTQILYGLRAGNLTGPPAGKVEFKTSERCIQEGTTTCSMDEFESKNYADKQPWWDTPATLHCKVGMTNCLVTSPTFWNRVRLTTVNTYGQRTPDTTALSHVDTWTLQQSFPKQRTDSHPPLWLESITRTGYGTTKDEDGNQTSTQLPAVTFVANVVDMPNRVATSPKDDTPDFDRLRVETIRTESGGDIYVDYSTPCPVGTPHPTPEANTSRCFPVHWSPDPDLETPPIEWFNKYVVDRVIEKDRAAREPDVTTTYTYGDENTPGAAWAKDTDEFSKSELRTYSQWRGYASVTVTRGENYAGTTGGYDRAEQSKTTTRYFRGMSRDAGRAAITVKDSANKETLGEDLPAYQGNAAETITYTSSSGSATVQTRELSWPYVKETAKRVRGDGLPDLKAYRTGTIRTDKIETISSGTRTVRTDTAYDDTLGRTPAYGLPLTVHTTASDSDDTIIDEQCTATDYVHNASGDNNLVGLPWHTRTITGACPISGTAPAERTITESRTSYDALNAFGTAPTKGLSYQVDTIDGDGNGWITTARTTYDDLGRATKLTDAAGNNTTTAYVPATGTDTGPAFTIKTTNAASHTTSTTYDPGRGTPLTVTDANNRTTTSKYDNLGRVTDVWTASRNPSTDKAAVHFTYQFDDNKVPAVTTSTLRDNGTYDDAITLYDGMLRPRQTQTEALGGGRIVTDTLYNPSGAVRETKNGYLAPGEPTAEIFVPKTVFDVPNSTKTTYDGLGRPTRVTILKNDIAQHTATTQYNGDWTLARTGMNPAGTAPLQGSRAVRSWTDPLGRTSKIQHYTTAGVTEPATALDTTYTYDTRGQLTKITDPKNNNWTYSYDTRGRLTASTDPDVGAASFGYNNLDQRIWSKDTLDRVQYTLYDKLGRTTEVRDDSATGPLVAQYTYDTLTAAKGQPVASTRYNNGKAYTSEVTGYDAEYRPTGTKITIPTDTLTKGLDRSYAYSYDYTATGKLQAVTLPAVTSVGLAAEKVITRYSGEGAPLTTSGLAWYTAGTIYSPHGQVLRTVTGQAPRRIWTTNDYDQHTGRLSETESIRETANPHWITTLTYNYDTVGNVTSIKDQQSATQTDQQCFSYDPMGRLVNAWTGIAGCPTSATEQNAAAPSSTQVTPGISGTGYWQSYAFDSIGNRTSLTVRDPAGVKATETYKYDYGKTVSNNGTQSTLVQPHTLAAVSSTQDINGSTYTLRQSYNSDVTGNTTERITGSGTTTGFTWDRRNKLTSADSDNNGTADVTYLYDADGNRLIEATSATRTLYLGDTEITVNTAGEAVDAQRYYTHPGAPTTLRTTGGKSTGHKLTTLLADHHNTSTTAVEQTNSQNVIRRAFDPYGNPRGAQPTDWPSRHTFLGTGIDDATTGLTHIGAREYDPTTGRFISADPLIDITDPLQMNGYTYSNGNPVTNSDPTGLKLDDGSGGKGETFYKDAEWGTWDGTVADTTRAAFDKTVLLDTGPPRKWPRNGDTVGGKKLAQMQRKYDQTNGSVVDQLSFKMWAAGATDQEIEYFRSNYCEFVTCYSWKEALLTGTSIDSEIYDKSAAQLAGESMAGGLGARTLSGKGKSSKVGCGNSFAPGTEVLLSDGTTKPIEDLKVGETVLATDPDTGEAAPKQVTSTIYTQADKAFVDLTITTADGPRVITTTEHHPFWSASEQGWLDAGEIKPGMTLRTNHGTTATVQAARGYAAKLDTYNLTIADLHTYYVLAGATPVLVHNSTPCGPDLDALSQSGMRPAKGNTTHAGREYQKHMNRGDLPVVPGKQLKSAGQDLLDDILTNPKTATSPVNSGNFAGGTRYIMPDPAGGRGVGATFDANGQFQYFGRY
ncbi:polymorphic toxin-type HINT domain-containing protein [Streptomyces sp. NPDC058583]|uniref:polymorphic toxin-type HINT domain-containing protein n=1 Tax=unclassified Streptomyces TaxID=2593676 RepID=UPI00364946DC